MLRALGMTRRQVLGQILAEAAMLGVAGSVLGLAAGLALSQGLMRVMEVVVAQKVQDMQVPLSGLVSALLVGVGVTLAAAAIPARQASRISPLEALRVRGRLEGRLVRPPGLDRGPGDPRPVAGRAGVHARRGRCAGADAPDVRDEPLPRRPVSDSRRGQLRPSGLLRPAAPPPLRAGGPTRQPQRPARPAAHRAHRRRADDGHRDAPQHPGDHGSVRRRHPFVDRTLHRWRRLRALVAAHARRVGPQHRGGRRGRRGHAHPLPRRQAGARRRAATNASC